MLPLILGSVAAVFVLKASAKSNAIAGANNTSVKGTFSTNPQTSKKPSSAQAPRANQGNQANQPWYTGPAIAGGTALLVGVGSSVGQMAGDLFSGSDSGDDPDPTEVEEATNDVSDSSNEDYADDYDATIETDLTD